VDKRAWYSGDGPTAISTSLSRILGRITQTSAKTLTDLIDHWPTLVGEEISAVSAPLKVESDTVTVRCDRADYATHLKVSWPQIRETARAQGIDAPSAISVVLRPR
jgi:hypothetical protein